MYSHTACLPAYLHKQADFAPPIYFRPDVCGLQVEVGELGAVDSFQTTGDATNRM